jgi:hypothetical protein
MSVNNCNRIKEMLTELKPIVDKVPMDQNKFKEFMTKYNLGNSETILNNIGICSSVAVNIGDNIVSVPRECVTTVERACRLEEERGVNYQECYKKYRPSIRNITQDNVATVDQICNITSLLRDESVQRNTQLALLLKLLLGNVNVSCEQGVANSFTFLNNNLNSVDVLNNCLNESFLIQQNKLNVCYADGVYQENIANIIQNCIVKSNIESGTPVSGGGGGGGDPRSGDKPEKVNRIIKFDPSQLKKDDVEQTGGNSNTNVIVFVVIIILLLLCSSSSLFMVM